MIIILYYILLGLLVYFCTYVFLGYELMHDIYLCKYMFVFYVIFDMIKEIYILQVHSLHMLYIILSTLYLYYAHSTLLVTGNQVSSSVPFSLSPTLPLSIYPKSLKRTLKQQQQHITTKTAKEQEEDRT